MMNPKNDQTHNQVPMPAELGAEGMKEIEAAITAADEYIPNELPYHQRHGMTNGIDRLLIDSDFDSTLRDMLIAFEDEGFDIREFLADQTKWGIYSRDTYGDDWHTPRYLDLIRVHRMLCYLADPENYGRDELSQLYMSHSLCPMHHIDWAICFDDQDEECSAIRTIFPHHHDT